jgi:hypothetical protein
MRWRPDQIDLWCEDWARERRKVLGLDLGTTLAGSGLKLRPEERLGRLSCTLGAVVEEKVGAGERTERVNENGHRNQNWPEVYTGMALEVHRGFCAMRFEWRQVMDMQYALRTTPTKIKADFLGIKTAMYWQRFGHMKIFLAGFLRLERVETQKSRKSVGRNLISTLASA